MSCVFSSVAALSRATSRASSSRITASVAAPACTYLAEKRRDLLFHRNNDSRDFLRRGGRIHFCDPPSACLCDLLDTSEERTSIILGQ